MTDIQLPVRFMDGDRVVAVLSMGSAEGPQYPTLYMGGGDIVNVRNEQGGFDYGDGRSGQYNLDHGAGSADHRGNIVNNYDVGNGDTTYDGRKKLVWSINKGNDRLIQSHLPMRIWAGAKIRRADGTWHTL